MNTTSSTHYDPISRAFHWLTAIAILAAFILGPEHFGRMIRDGVDPATRSGIVWHETLGITIFALTLLRLIWVAFRRPAPRFEMAGWMQWASGATHLALWVLMLITPMAAMLALGSEAHPLTLLGGIRVNEMPAIANAAIASWADWGEVHGFLGDAIIALAGLHAVAAIYHHVMLKDGVLVSMLPHK